MSAVPGQGWREKGSEFERVSGTGTEREPDMSFVIGPQQSELGTRVETGIGTWRGNTFGVEKETERDLERNYERERERVRVRV